MADLDVRRVDFGFFVRPAEETRTGAPRTEPCLGYVVQHPGGILLFDTGMGSDPEVDVHYRPRRRSVPEALSSVGLGLNDVTEVANCHLHFDHCGGNPLLPNRPVFTQAAELADARHTADYTLPELIFSPETRYVELTGQSEVLPGVLLLPTPGHTSGHQSLVVRREDGTVVVAGQSHEGASAFSADVLARHAHAESHSEPLPVTPEWLERLLALDPARVVFAHDHATWQP